jgi:hypothetical protein
MEIQRSILHHLGVEWRGREKDPDREQLPERWVDLINYLETQERLTAPLPGKFPKDRERSSLRRGQPC